MRKRFKEALTNAIAFTFIVFIILPIWFIAGYVEQSIMWLKGYDWDKGWGGYVHRKTGKRA